MDADLILVTPVGIPFRKMMIPLSASPSDHLTKEALMAQWSKAKGSRRQTKLNIIYTPAAGIDVGSTFHVVAVPPELSAEPVQTFSSFTGRVPTCELAVEIGVTTVAMESTGIYWIPVFDILEAHGLEVLLVNAQHAKTVPGRKTDVNDAQWLQQNLHTYGLLRGSFHPAQDWSALRCTDGIASA